MTDKRIWLEQKLEDTEYIKKLQEEMTRDGVLLEAHDLEGIHLTLFHFGIPNELFEDIKKEVHELKFEEFEKASKELFLKWENEFKGIKSLESLELDIFGGEQYKVLVLKMKISDELIEVRKILISSTKEFLEELGISDPNNFISSSLDLKFDTESEYKPHITLGSASLVNESLYSIESEVLEFKKPVLRGVE